jgi:hypothetical protein
MSITDIKCVDGEGCELQLDSYAGGTRTTGPHDYAFVLLTQEEDRRRLHTVGLNRAQAKELAYFILTELMK